MKKLVILFFLTTISYGQDFVKDLNPFKSITVKAALDIELVPSSKFKIEVKGEGIDLLKITSQNNELTLDLPLKNKFQKALKAIIYYKPGLRYMNFSHYTHVHSSDTITENFIEVNATDNVDISLTLDVKDFSSTLDLGSSIQLFGNTESQHIKVKNKSVYDAFNFKSKKTFIEALRASQAAIYVSEFLDAKAKLKSEITYMGEPYSVNEKTFLGKVIRKKEK